MDKYANPWIKTNQNYPVIDIAIRNKTLDKEACLRRKRRLKIESSRVDNTWDALADKGLTS